MKFQIKKDYLTLIDKEEPINSGSINYYEIDCVFDESWNNLVKKAIIIKKGSDKGVSIAVIDDKIYIDKNNFGFYKIGFVGYSIENEEKTYQISTNLKEIYFNKGAGEIETTNGEDIPTPTEWEIYLASIQEFINNANEILSEAEEKIEDMTEALEDVDAAIEQTNNLDVDIDKVDKTATVTLTKKDGTEKTIEIDDGISLQFMWQGTYLGIKTEEQEEYTFVNLQGVQGVTGPQGEPFKIKKTYPSVEAMNADFNNMEFGDYVMIASTVEVEDNAKLYTRGENQWIFITDFSGATGIQGPTGVTPNIQIGTVTQGNTPSVTKSGTDENPVLNFVLVKGDKGDTGNTGETGNGILNIQKTSTSGLIDTYTITFTNGNTTTFNVTNGNGITSIAKTSTLGSVDTYTITFDNGNITTFNITNGEVTQEQLDEVIAQIPTGTANGESIILTDSADFRLKEIVLQGNTEQDGTPTPETPAEIENVKGDAEVSIQNKNLFDITSTFPIEKNGLTFTKNNDGTITINGTASITFTQTFTLKNQLLNGNYMIKHTTMSGSTSQNCYMTIQDSNNNNISDRVYGDGISSSLSLSNITIVTAGIYINSGTRFTNYTVGSQLEAGTVATSFIGHQEQTATFTLEEGQFLGDGDYLADDGIHKVKEQLILDGTENWAKSNSMTGGDYFGAYTQTKHWGADGYFANKNSFITDYFLSNDLITGDYQFISSTGYACYLKINNTIVNSVEDLKTWLSNHNVKIEYTLINPIVIPYTQTQQAQWNVIKSLHTYKNITNINVTSNVNPGLNIVYYKDLETIIENIEERLSSLE